MSSVSLVREPVVHNLNLAVILAFISWVEPTLLVVATATCPFPRPAGEGWDWGRLQAKIRSSENFGIWVLGKPVRVHFQTTFYSIKADLG